LGVYLGVDSRGERSKGFFECLHPDVSDVSIVRRVFLFFFIAFSSSSSGRGGGLGSLVRFGRRGRGSGARTHLIIFLDCPHLPFHCCPPSSFLGH